MNIYSCYRGPLCRKNGKNAAKAATDLHYPAVTAEFQGCVLFNVREIIVPAGSCCFFKVGGTILMACLHGGNLKKQRRRIGFSAFGFYRIFTMQTRHQDRSAYFEETATSCRNYYLPYIEQHTSLKFGRKCRVMEVGCGIGGILSIFAAMGATVTGIDIHKPSIETAKTLFAERGLKGTFICSDIFDYSDTQPYDLIILHDALEHIPEKERLMLHLKSFLKADGLLYLGFPAWQMPFGGHQQMAKNRIIANCPYIHLLPRPLFRFVFRACGEKESTVKCFFEIRDTRITIEGFHKLVTATGLRIVNQRLYFINPNYQVKFGLKPRILSPVIGKIPYVRNFFTTTCYCLLAMQEGAN